MKCPVLYSHTVVLRISMGSTLAWTGNTDHLKNHCQRYAQVEQGKSVRTPPPKEEGAEETTCHKLTTAPVPHHPEPLVRKGRKFKTEAEPRKKGGGKVCFKIWSVFPHCPTLVFMGNLRDLSLSFPWPFLPLCAAEEGCDRVAWVGTWYPARETHHTNRYQLIQFADHAVIWE